MAVVLKKETTSFDVDAQNGFTPLCPDELPVAEGHEIVEELNKQAIRARLRVGSGDWHPEGGLWETDNPEMIGQPLEKPLPSVDLYWPQHCVAGTFGASQIEGLPLQEEYDFFVRKGQSVDRHPYGACYDDLDSEVSTGLIEYLKSEGISTVIVGGLALEYCVKFSILQLLEGGFRVILNKGAVRGIDKEVGEKAIQEMLDQGAEVVDTASDIDWN